MQILVLGMHRSGTSMITRLINMMGAYFAPEGRSLGYSADNPKGYWERRDVVELNDMLLRYNQCDWQHLAAWPAKQPLPASPQHQHAMRSLILEMDGHRPWVMKDPRLCLTLPYWRPYLEVPVGVIVYRNPLEIAQSLHARDQMPLAAGLALWEHYAVNMLNATLKMPRLFVSHSHALNYPLRFVKALHETLTEQLDVRGLRQPSEKEVRAFINRKLYRARSEDMKTPLPLTPFQQMLVDILEQKAPHKAVLSVSTPSLLVMKQYGVLPGSR